jgi:hypothetical protein
MKRWFIIRHIRWMWLVAQLNAHIQKMQDCGLGWYLSDSDRQYLDDVWRGNR